MQTWLSIEEFAKLVGKSQKEIKILCKKGKLSYKKDKSGLLIEANKAAQALIPISNAEVLDEVKGNTILEKTISTIINLHSKVLEAKDETIESLKRENEFLKSSVISMQEVYEEDRKTIETLQNQVKLFQEELEFCRKKYKLMWGKVIKNADNSDED
ncbi:MAG: DUF3972 domain-containing protein [Epsilonproteobacteria bacterium]|nr:DUF3972 domain-containing protein [Campylobacterota bacterium]